jgi:hypothetical protein
MDLAQKDVAIKKKKREIWFDLICVQKVKSSNLIRQNK